MCIDMCVDMCTYICPGVRSKIGERLEQGGVAEIEWDGDMFAAQTSAAQDDEGAGIGQWRHTKKDQWADTKQDRSQEESRSYAFCMHRMHAACMLNVRCMYVACTLHGGLSLRCMHIEKCHMCIPCMLNVC